MDERRTGGKPKQAGDLVSRVLRDMGVPSQRIGTVISRAWINVCEPAWVEETKLRRLEGGVLEIGVRSAALRDELTHFHRDRLLEVMRVALPDVALIGMRFVPETNDRGA